jgi:hypothetical protein
MVVSPRMSPAGSREAVRQHQGVPVEGGIIVAYMTTRGLLEKDFPSQNPLYGMLRDAPLAARR